MATVDDLRLKILDRPQVVLDEIVGTGDGFTKLFKLRRAPVMEGTIHLRIGVEEKNEGTDYEVDYTTGKLVFAEAPGEGEVVVASYDFAAFSDSELQAFLDSSGGNLALAAGEALTSLISDRSRLVTWSRSDVRIDYDKLREDLAIVARRYLSQGRTEAGRAKIEEIDWEDRG